MGTAQAARGPRTPLVIGWILVSVVAFLAFGVLALVAADAVFGDMREREIALSFQILAWGSATLVFLRATGLWILGSVRSLSGWRTASVAAGLAAAVATTFATVGSARQGAFLDADALGFATFLPITILAATAGTYALGAFPPSTARPWALTTALVSAACLILVMLNVLYPPSFAEFWFIVLLLLAGVPAATGGYYSLRTLTTGSGRTIDG